jgi:hypothetical protein
VVQHIPGERNKMTDYSSRSYTPSLHLHEDSHLFASFTSVFPLPHNLSRKHALSPRGVTSLIFSTLGGRLQPLESLMSPLVSNNGTTGSIMPIVSTLTLFSSPVQSNPLQHNTSVMPSKPSVLGCRKETTVKEHKSATNQLIKLGAPLDRPAHCLDTQTQRKRSDPTSAPPPSNINRNLHHSRPSAKTPSIGPSQHHYVPPAETPASTSRCGRDGGIEPVHNCLLLSLAR